MNKKIFWSALTMLLFCFITISATLPSSDDNALLYIRVFESSSNLQNSRITVSDGETVIKTVDLKMLRPRKVGENVLMIAKTLNEFDRQGYSILSSSSGGDESFIYTDYILEKK